MTYIYIYIYTTVSRSGLGEFCTSLGNDIVELKIYALESKSKLTGTFYYLNFLALFEYKVNANRGWVVVGVQED